MALAVQHLKAQKMKDIRENHEFAVGTWEINLQTPTERKLILDALKPICKYVDTAIDYNNDYLIAKEVPSSYKLISKIAPCHMQCYDFMVDNHMKCLNRHHIDIMLIHSCRGDWKPLAKRINIDKRFLEVGVSNFNSEELEEYKQLIGKYPAYNEIEINPRYTDNKTVAFCEKNGIKVIAYGIYGGKYNAMTNIAEYSLPFMLKYAAAFADILILKPESERQVFEVRNVIENYNFDDGNVVTTTTDNIDDKAVVPMRYSAKNIVKKFFDVQTYHNAVGANKWNGEQTVDELKLDLPKFEMLGDYMAYVRYLYRQNQDAHPETYHYDFLIGDDGKYYVVHLLDEYNRLTKINTTGKVKVLKIS